MEMTEPCFPLPHQLPIKSRRRRGHGRESRGKASGQRAEPSAAAATEEPACLQGAQLNTTLALKAELESLEGAEFNAQRAIEETLQKSTRVKNLISSRASEGVNVSHSQLLFTSLVSVDVQKDQLISRVLQDRLLLAPPPHISGHKSLDAPSLLTFLTSDLHRQKALPPDDDDPLSSRPILTPTPRPAYSTFDLYRQRVRWEATD
ncbi:protein phosphatase 1 regulatory subunit 35 isoform X2 [Thalassophryne amazonica]|uniref:protein phosphatase 1 regulatory subunit 35 isoform X2 n=1 Tax=Thalassophryne amazonica TaxID=390379 RepID=UPI0014726725|nr:protein phosphatase 1 regulatory subunit 35 isoform X2 [Thalassophryne amazonica]